MTVPDGCTLVVHSPCNQAVAIRAAQETQLYRARGCAAHGDYLVFKGIPQMLLRLTPREWTIYKTVYQRIMAEDGIAVVMQLLQWGDVYDSIMDAIPLELEAGR